MNLKNKTVTVIGLGNSGVNAAMLLNSVGAKVKATDFQDTPSIRDAAKTLEDRDVKIELGVHTEDFIEKSDLIIVSPGVEDSSPAMRWARSHRIPIMSELELGFRFCRGSIIGVTGTNGKSTVATLISEILKDGGKDTILCGNIGNSLSGEISRIKDDTWVVLEISSFQLERIGTFKPRIALILNITDDHLDRYKNFTDYFNEKLKIFREQDADDVLILNYDAKNLKGIEDKADSKVLFYSRRRKTNGVYIKNGWITCILDGEEKYISRISDVKLKGLYNLENVLASTLVGALVGVKGDEIEKTIKNFKGLIHRFETIDVINGIEYVDDSKGTTVDSTYRALESCEKPVILIAGGRDKFSNYSVIKDMIREKVRCMILIGEAKGRIKKALGGAVDTYESGCMMDAVELAARLAKENEVVLLSPMCSSFDMFKDYKHRGEVFRDAVERLK